MRSGKEHAHARTTSPDNKAAVAACTPQPLMVAPRHREESLVPRRCMAFRPQGFLSPTSGACSVTSIATGAPSLLVAVTA